MTAIIVVGAQWGDEGKGKATDILGGKVDYVVKPNGGNNAGHTVVVGGEKYELKLLPAGVLSENATPVIGNGCVVNSEEHSVIGGLGSAVSELLGEKCPVPVLRHGVNDEFGRSGTAAAVLDYFGLNAEGIAAKVREALKLKK